MPEPRTTTLNRRGRTTDAPTEYGLAFIDRAAVTKGPVLDIGAAFGVVAIPALESGATVIANDIEPRHLEILKSNVPPELLANLTLLPGRFPRGLEFAPNSLDAIHAANLLNFLTGSEIEAGMTLAYRWLKPSGKLYLVSGTPFAGNVAAFIPEYERRVKAGWRWPGEVTGLERYSDHPTIAELPEFLHLVDDDVLRRTLEATGFEIERLEMYERAGLPSHLAHDGRENVGVIARKPTIGRHTET